MTRREGEPVAKHLQEWFGTPDLLDRPYGIRGTFRWIDEIAELSGISPNSVFVTVERTEGKTLHFCVG